MTGSAGVAVGSAAAVTCSTTGVVASVASCGVDDGLGATGSGSLLGTEGGGAAAGGSGAEATGSTVSVTVVVACSTTGATVSVTPGTWLRAEAGVTNSMASAPTRAARRARAPESGVLRLRLGVVVGELKAALLARLVNELSWLPYPITAKTHIIYARTQLFSATFARYLRIFGSCFDEVGVSSRVPPLGLGPGTRDDSRVSAMDEYLDELPPEQNAALARVRALVGGLVPEAEEGKSYGVPAFVLDGRPLLGFSAAKAHLSLFPFSPAALDTVRDRLEGFDLAKGTIRFSPGQPVPDDVLADLVRARQREISPGP